MGLGSISIWQLVIILLIVLLLFGAKKLRNIGSDLGSAVKGFRTSMKEGEEDAQKADNLQKHEDPKVIEGQVTHKEDVKPKDTTRV